MKSAILFAGVALVAGSANAATIVWQGGSGNFSDANWTVAGTPNQNHPSFGDNNNNAVVHNTTINLAGIINGFNNALVGAIGNDDSLFITGGASIFGDVLMASSLAPDGISHANDITLQNGSLTFSDANAYRSPMGTFTGLVNFTGAAGSAFARQTNNTVTATSLAGKITSNEGTTSFFSLDGTMVATGGVVYNGTNLAAINTALANTVSGGRFFQIEDAGGIQTLYIVPEPSTALLGGLGMLALLRRRRA